MKKRLLVALLLTLIALGTIGYSYACFNGGFFINGYCNCNIEFTAVTTTDNEIEKNVAAITAQITCDRNTINAYITNAYPCYQAHITYTIRNKGNRPVHFSSVTIINPNPEALEITTTNHTCIWLQPWQTVQGTTTVHALQAAQQNWQYTFQIQIAATCQNPCPHTIGYWKNQFSACLRNKGNPQTPPTTLETYLNQITSQSKIFKFTGIQTQKFWQALIALNPPAHSSMEAKLKAQLLALQLNHVAEYTQGYTINGLTAQKIIHDSENGLLNHQISRYVYWKNLCGKFNNLGGI
jgi:hypothetical protein